MASSDALPIPRKNTAFRVYFPMIKNDGSVITGWTGAAASVSKDGGTAASATNTPTEIASSFGVGYLDLTATEMNADAVVVKATVTNSGALAQVVVLYPQEAGDIRANATYWNDTAVATPDTAGYPKVTVKDGTGAGEIDLTSGKVDVNDKTGFGLADGAITAAKIASNAIDADAVAADAASEIAAAVVGATLTGSEPSNTVGGKLNAAGAAGDPLISDVPGSYDEGTAGWYLGQLGTIRDKTLLITAGNVSFSTPTDPITGDLTVVRGDDYTVTSGRALPEWSSDDWLPFDLTNATSITFRARTRYSDVVVEKAATALSDTQVRVELAAADTDGLAVGHDAYRFDLEAVLASGDVVTLAQGRIHVLEDVRG
ncbi:MAG: hypothetical protein U0703_18765 [Anaerolineae bacterium]